jgi:uncharacterized protein YegL
MKNHLDVHLLIDRSASMGGQREVVVEEINRLMDEIRTNDPDATVSILTFDGSDPSKVMVDRVPARRIRHMTLDHYKLGSGTPLLDAVGAALNRASERLARDPRRGYTQVLFAVITDGDERDSVRYLERDITGKLRRRRAAGWELLYLGLGRAMADGARLGFRPGEIHPLDPGPEGTQAAFATIAEHTRRSSSLDGFLGHLRGEGR